MPGWVRTLLASVGAGLITAAVAYLILTAVRPDPELTVAKGDRRAVSVDDAIAAPRGDRIAVRGFVFLDEQAGELLCSARTTDDRPACAGSSLRLVDLDTSRLDLAIAPVAAGGYDAWSREPVVLIGRVDRLQLTVEDLLAG